MLSRSFAKYILYFSLKIDQDIGRFPSFSSRLPEGFCNNGHGSIILFFFLLNFNFILQVQSFQDNFKDFNENWKIAKISIKIVKKRKMLIAFPKNFENQRRPRPPPWPPSDELHYKSSLSGPRVPSKNLLLGLIEGVLFSIESQLFSWLQGQ